MQISNFKSSSCEFQCMYDQDSFDVTLITRSHSVIYAFRESNHLQLEVSSITVVFTRHALKRKWQ